jgi:hypothetical protein
MWPRWVTVVTGYRPARASASSAQGRGPRCDIQAFGLSHGKVPFYADVSNPCASGCHARCSAVDPFSSLGGWQPCDEKAHCAPARCGSGSRPLDVGVLPFWFLTILRRRCIPEDFRPMLCSVARAHERPRKCPAISRRGSTATSAFVPGNAFENRGRRPVERKSHSRLMPNLHNRWRRWRRGALLRCAPSRRFPRGCNPACAVSMRPGSYKKR